MLQRSVRGSLYWCLRKNHNLCWWNQVQIRNSLCYALDGNIVRKFILKKEVYSWKAWPWFTQFRHGTVKHSPYALLRSTEGRKFWIRFSSKPLLHRLHMVLIIFFPSSCYFLSLSRPNILINTLTYVIPLQEKTRSHSHLKHHVK
jgi:hypothetical protein